MPKPLPSGSELTIALDYPVEVNGASVSQITIRPPKVRDTITATKLHKDPAESEVALLANLAQWEPSAVKEMVQSDYDKAMNVVKRFFGSSETTADDA
jgi:hypothetical protein